MKSVKNGYYISGAFDAGYNSSGTAGKGEQLDVTTYSQQYGDSYNYVYDITILPNVDK
ncbi:MAG: hypothetical protein LBC19_08880 [Tannerella sp.]|jgi:hypothetical protein|nr:hypothetical protein [Tannerella sp.]